MAHVSDLTDEVILKIAHLANLILDKVLVGKFRTQLTETIHYVENLDELDTTDIKPTSHSTQMMNVFFEDGTKNKRGFSQQEATQNGKQVKNGVFIVPRIMEQ